MSEKQKPTIAELQALLDAEPGKIELLPDGSITVAAELTALRAELERTRARLKEARGLIERAVNPFHAIVQFCDPENPTAVECRDILHTARAFLAEDDGT